jgi:D-inositol-3-phosphate glycosyltransferase
MKKNSRPKSAASSRALVASGPDEALAALPLVTRKIAPQATSKKAANTAKAAKPNKPAKSLAKKSVLSAKPVKPKKKTASQKPVSKPKAKRKKVKGRLLWIGDAVVPTGFATVTHSILQHLRRDWEVIVSGVNYDGQRHAYPYRILPARQGHGDMWGMNRFASLCAEFAPDVVVINSDWWNVAGFLQRAPKGLPIVAYMPVDGANLDSRIVPQLNGLAAAIWYSDFGHREAAQAGFRGARHVISHGIATDRWRPVTRTIARDLLDLPVPSRAFIVGNINRNQPRKRLDVTMQYFAEWTRQHKVSDAWLLLHCAKQDTGWDLESLARHHGIADRLLLTGGSTMHDAVDPAKLQLVYSALDVQVTTTLGEGWGLTTMEGMACGVPQLVPDWAALGEWADPAVKVSCSVQLAYPGINTIGALPDKAVFINELHRLYREPATRAKLSRASLAFISQPQFSWSEIARQMEEVVSQACASHAHRMMPALR